MKTKWWTGGLFYIIIILMLIALGVGIFQSKGPDPVSFYTFIDYAKQGQIDTIYQDGPTLTGLKSNKEIVSTSFVGSTKELIDSLSSAGISLTDGKIKLEVKAGGIDWGSVIITFLPLLLIVGLLFMLFRSARGVNTQAFNFGKSRARLAADNKPQVNFDDVAGVDEAKGELFFAWSNKSLTREAPTPTNISTNSLPLMEKNGTPASPATALAISVLPHPGGPTSNTPLGILAPSARNF